MYYQFENLIVLTNKNIYGIVIMAYFNSIISSEWSKLSNTFSKSIDTVSISHLVEKHYNLCIHKIAKFDIVD